MQKTSHVAAMAAMAAIVSFSLLPGCSGAKPAETKLAQTKLADLSGNVKALGEHAGEKGLMLLFVDTACPFSNRAVSEISGVAERLGEYGVTSVLVNIDEDAETVKAFYDKLGLKLPVVYDPTAATTASWDIRSVPTVVLIESSGQIAYKGPALWDNVADAGEEALGLAKGTLRFVAKGTGYG